MTGYRHASLRDLERREVDPDVVPDRETLGERWNLSPQLGVDGYNVNVAVMDPGERFPGSGYHYHEEQQEFFFVVSGHCRAEVADGHVDLAAEEMIVFDPGTAQLVHNPFDAPATAIAIGHPAEAHFPAEATQSFEELLLERYGTDRLAGLDPD